MKKKSKTDYDYWLNLWNVKMDLGYVIDHENLADLDLLMSGEDYSWLVNKRSGKLARKNKRTGKIKGKWKD